MALYKYETIQELHNSLKEFIKSEILRITGKTPEDKDVFSAYNIALVTGDTVENINKSKILT